MVKVNPKFSQSRSINNVFLAQTCWHVAHHMVKEISALLSCNYWQAIFNFTTQHMHSAIVKTHFLVQLCCRSPAELQVPLSSSSWWPSKLSQPSHKCLKMENTLGASAHHLAPRKREYCGATWYCHTTQCKACCCT